MRNAQERISLQNGVLQMIKTAGVSVKVITYKTFCERVDVLLVVKQGLLLSDFTQRKPPGD